jgi:uncharacterized protein
MAEINPASLADEVKPRPYWNSYMAGIGLGLVLLAAFVLTGRGLGASSAATRIAALSVHKVDAMVHGGTEAERSTVITKNGYLSQYFSGAQDPLDDFLVYLLVGVIIGGFISGLQGRRISMEVTKGPHTTNLRRIVLAIVGGVIAAFGARLARGCTSGQALTGGATLALGSWAFMMCVFAGGYGMAWFMRKEWL